MASNLDYALLAGVAYRSTCSDDNKFPISQNWVELPGIYRRIDDIGFEAVAFKNGSEIVISYAGKCESLPPCDFLDFIYP